MTKENKQLLIGGLVGIGNVAGILLAVKRKSGFWGGVGWFVVGGLAGASVGYVASSVLPTTASDIKLQAGTQIVG